MNTPPNHNTTAADTIIPRYLQPQNPCKDVRKLGKKHRQPQLGDPVIVHWDDAQTTAISWEEHNTTYQPMPTVTIGFLHEHTTSHITLTSIYNLTHHAHSLVIPTGCITHITTL